MSFFLFRININNNNIITVAKKVMDRPLEILRGGGGEYKKNISARDNLMEKIYACNLTLKNIHAIA